MKRHDIITSVSKLLSSTDTPADLADRVGQVWSGYLSRKLLEPIEPIEVLHMLMMLNIVAAEEDGLDDRYIELCYQAACASEMQVPTPVDVKEPAPDNLYVILPKDRPSFMNREEAEDGLDMLDDHYKEKHYLTVADYYDILAYGEGCGNPGEAPKYGWTQNISEFQIIAKTDGTFTVATPPAELLPDDILKGDE